MLSLLLDKNFWIYLTLIATVIGLIIVYAKFPKSKKAIMTALVVIALTSAIYSGYQIYRYETSNSAIFGTYNSSDNDNQLETNALTFNFKNVEMMATGNENEYSATFTTEDVLSLDEDKSYMVYVNNMPCDSVEISEAKDFVIATYQYNYYNESKEVIENDTLTINFACYPNGTTVVVKTQGGASAVKYWNYYFNKNNFVLTFEETDVIYAPDISYGEGTVTYISATYYIEDIAYITQVYKPNSKVIFPKLEHDLYGYWSVDGEERLTEYTITENTTFKAMYFTDKEFCEIAYSKMENGVLDLSGYPITTIPQGQFGYRSDIKEVVFPNTLEVIYGGAFFNTSITTINIPNSVTTLGNFCFSNTKLTTVSIPSSVIEIGYGAFAYCDKLTEITLPPYLTKISANVDSYIIYDSNNEKITKTFYGCSSELVITCDFEEGDHTYVEGWNNNGEVDLEVIYNGNPEDSEPGNQKPPINEDDDELYS